MVFLDPGWGNHLKSHSGAAPWLLGFLLDLNGQLARGRDDQQGGLAAARGHAAGQHVGEGRKP